MCVTLRATQACTIPVIVPSNSCFPFVQGVCRQHLLVDTFPGLGLDPVVGPATFEAIISLFVATQTNAPLEKIVNANWYGASLGGPLCDTSKRS